MDYKKWLFDVSVWLVIILTARHANAAEGSARQSEWVNDYAVSWNSPSLDSKGSMPLGNGDIGLNAWVVKDGDLWCYISKGDSWGDWPEGHNGLLKVGRVRVKLTPNPFMDGQPFLQKLNLAKGQIEITAGKPGSRISLLLRVDANRPVVRLDGQGEAPFTIEAVFESTRPKDGPRNFDRLVAGLTNEVAWYYRSKDWADYKNRCFGALMRGPNLVGQGGASLLSEKPSKAFQLSVHALARHPTTPEEWMQALHAQAEGVDQAPQETARQQHEQWWQAFWDRSWIQVTGDTNAWQVTQGYILQRFKNACAGRGRWPIHFNGSIFTVDTIASVYNPKIQKEEPQPVNGDWRAWGCRFWWQNTRAMYWPMLASGDFDMMQPLFNFYLRTFDVNRRLVRERHGFDGVYFSEITPMEGGLTGAKLTPELKGEFVAHHINSILEFSALSLDYFQATGDETFARETLIPIADGGLTFFANYFPRDAHGRLLLDPDNALETYWKVRNPTPDVAGLRWVTDGLLALPERLTTPEMRKRWQETNRILPAIPLGMREGRQVILPCEKMNPETRNPGNDGKPEMESYLHVHNMENPELYAVYPFRVYGVGKPDLARALATYETQRFPYVGCWHQTPVVAAYLGLAREARESVEKVFDPVFKDQTYPYPSPHQGAPKENGFRFPAFWGPGHDYAPDEDHGGNGMHALQLMLMQCEGRKILLAPAWPKEWNCQFKLCAPGQTIVEGQVVEGKVLELNVTPKARAQDVEIRPAQETKR